MDIDFGCPKKYTVTGTFYLPDNYIVDALPKNTKMLLPDSSIVLTRMMQQDHGLISINFTLEMNASGYTADSYPYIKQFFKKMYDILEEKIVLKKK